MFPLQRNPIWYQQLGRQKPIFSALNWSLHKLQRRRQICEDPFGFLGFLTPAKECEVLLRLTQCGMLLQKAIPRQWSFALNFDKGAASFSSLCWTAKIVRHFLDPKADTVATQGENLYLKAPWPLNKLLLEMESHSEAVVGSLWSHCDQSVWNVVLTSLRDIQSVHSTQHVPTDASLSMFFNCRNDFTGRVPKLKMLQQCALMKKICQCVAKSQWDFSSWCTNLAQLTLPAYKPKLVCKEVWLCSWKNNTVADFGVDGRKCCAVLTHKESIDLLLKLQKKRFPANGAKQSVVNVLFPSVVFCAELYTWQTFENELNWLNLCGLKQDKRAVPDYVRHDTQSRIRGNDQNLWLFWTLRSRSRQQRSLLFKFKFFILLKMPSPKNTPESNLFLCRNVHM